MRTSARPAAVPVRLRLAGRLALGLLLTGVLVLQAAPGQAAIEWYPRYRPQTTCATHATPGAKMLRDWVVDTYGGAPGGILRGCKDGGTSEHKEGRALDWTLDATTKADRNRAQKFLARIFAADKRGRAHALARRMGVMYVIWNDHSYSAWRRYEETDYLSSGCPSRKKCSATLRHRDHLHISLSRPAARATTSWYARRLARQQG